MLDRTVLMLKNRFNLDYRYLASKKVGTERVKEIYVYLYRADRVEAIKSFGVYSDKEDDFIREPFIALFKAGEFDFYVITIHSIYGDGVGERRDEAKKLAVSDSFLSVAERIPIAPRFYFKPKLIVMISSRKIRRSQILRKF